MTEKLFTGTLNHNQNKTKKKTFSAKNLSRISSFRVSNSFDPDQARQYVGPDLGSNCLQRLLSADDTDKSRENF